MTRLTTLALVVATAITAVPAIPANAAGFDTVPYCSSHPGSSDNLRWQLETELLVHGQYLISLDDWNGCLKAITRDAHGNTTIAYYDDALSIIRQDN